MELRQESSNVRSLCATTTRNYSSSSSAFFSAIQSPFFSPRSPALNLLEETRATTTNSLGAAVTNSDLLSSSLIRRAESLSNNRLAELDASPVPSFCTSSNFDFPGTALESPDLISSYNAICNGNISNYSQGTSNGHPRYWQDKQRRIERNQGRLPSGNPSTSVTSASRLRNCDVYIGFHGRKSSLLRFVKWLRAELEIQGISCFACDRARCRSARVHDSVGRVMSFSTFGVVVLTKKSFGNPYTIEELRSFLGKKNLVPIFFDLGSGDCLARDIIENRGEIWEKHGGEIWMLYGGIEKEWREAVDGLSRTQDWQLEADGGNWRDCISRTVTLLATKLGRRSVVDRINSWREKAEREELPFPRNVDFVGRRKELSELEMILFGDVSGDAEGDFFELKTRNRRKSMLISRVGKHGGVQTKEQMSESSSKGKEPVLWKESDKEIEMQRLGSPQRQHRPLRSKNGGRRTRRKKSMKILYGKGIACISGESGIGKTEVVLEYAYRFLQRYKMILWVGGEGRYIRQNYLNLRTFLEVDISSGNHYFDKGKVRSFEEQEEEAIARIRKELMRDIPYLVVIDNLESEKDWWDRKLIMDILPRFGGETHFIITTRLPQVMNLEPMKLSFLSGSEAMCLMKGSVTDYPITEIDALRAIEEKLERLPLGLGIVGAILSELPITPSRLLDAVNRMPSRDFTWNDRETLTLKRHQFLIQLLDVCLSIFDHAEGPRSLPTRMVQVSGWFAPAAIPVPLLAFAAHNIPGKHHKPTAWKKFLRTLTCSFGNSRLKKSEAEASSMLVRFGLARSTTRPNCIQFHENIKLYSQKRGNTRIAQAVVQTVCLRGSLSQCSEHIWAACLLLFGIGTDPVVVEAKPSELLAIVKRVVLPLAIHTFITYSRCNAALELLRSCTDTLESTAEALVTQSEKWFSSSLCCTRPVLSEAHYTYLWQELALLRATVLETRAKLMLRGGRYDLGDDLIRKAIFIRTMIFGEDHPDTMAARETLSKLTRLLTSTPVS